ncbi:uncharacterized protein TRAVEDRAFT_46266 [Trametes versicolor FP-101664 SS1]|uniref:uncharacterized protein n=1 Tax=Trametes versicolor (strain FP-101664) TaxID=717944 RepID=UPI0004621D97|nr:uncharacterized protein TRAVEDRAFT_46266 [Trametes versicolor FP-101664 SS1]EIW61042.1 hypothetical protein TRAVEDRAFT_46266 [Trametes versicolor FP-101664 SS1]
MDSQLTHVNSSEWPDRRAHIELVFDHDSLTNANLLVKGGTMVICCIRTGRSMSRTELFQAGPIDEPLQPNGGAPTNLVRAARIDRNEILPDAVTFAGMQEIMTKKWLQGNTFSANFPGSGEVRYIRKPTSMHELAVNS